jgi:nicotinate-nucleotide adenylyltransferase
MKKRTGIFGGSFDPVHSGHIALAHSFLDSGLIHNLLVLLTPEAPHKQGRNKTPYKNRLAMLKLAFEGVENVEISTLETQLPEPSFTLQTIEYLQKNHPGTLFYLCMGEDSLVHFHQWHKFREILKRVDLIVAERPGYDYRCVSEEILESVIMVDHRPVDASSTDVREQLERESFGIKKEIQLPEPVWQYIEKKGLYGRG